MKHLVLTITLAGAALGAAPPSYIARSPETATYQPYKTVHAISVAALVGTAVSDVGSSWGHRERNPIMADRNGRCSSRAAIIKAGVVGGILLMDHFVLRRHRKAAAIINFAAAGVQGAVTIGNLKK